MNVLNKLQPVSNSLEEYVHLLDELLQFYLEIPRDGFISTTLFEAQILKYKCTNLKSKIILLEIELNNLIEDISKIATSF